ncbi:MAG: uroporphyrinogen decarboxylase family protein [Anaerolineaceae bacterium]
MNKKAISHLERLEICLSGDLPDRTPVALWRHFPVDDQKAEDLAAATLSFQKEYDFDLVKVTPASSYCVKDWGVQDVWQGNMEGTRDYIKFAIEHPEDWEKLPVLDPKKGYLAAQIRCLELITKELGPETPVIQTVFSPLSQAKNLVSKQKLFIHLRRYPEAVKKGLQTISESIRRFIEAAIPTGIAGIFYAVQCAQYGLLSENEYMEFGCPFDLIALEPASPLFLNMLHLHGEEVMFDLFGDYPISVINWHDRDTSPNLAEGQQRYKGVVCGGLQRERTMVLSNPEMVMAEARDAIAKTQGKRFILGTGCVLPVTTPRANILAARRSVE